MHFNFIFFLSQNAALRSVNLKKKIWEMKRSVQIQKIRVSIKANDQEPCSRLAEAFEILKLAEEASSIIPLSLCRVCLCLCSRLPLVSETPSSSRREEQHLFQNSLSKQAKQPSLRFFGSSILSLVLPSSVSSLEIVGWYFTSTCSYI